MDQGFHKNIKWPNCFQMFLKDHVTLKTGEMTTGINYIQLNVDTNTVFSNRIIYFIL